MQNETASFVPPFTNHLQHEKSPYLLQHAHNPVDWYPCGEVAFAKAKAENKPIFLSIGYATCHWCHVMEKESFEDQSVADLFNRDFICIKVDREERPDIDQVYMDVCVRLTGSGGWPLSLFLTPDKKPFFAGTYIPKQTEMSRPGLIDYLPLVALRWKEQPERFRERAEQVIEALQSDLEAQTDHALLGVDIFAATTNQLQQRFDAEYGGFGDAPKFPAPHNLSYLLHRYRRTGDSRLLQMVEKTLTAMRLGGLYDQVGFGFHRYSTDRNWLVPHFEKMLYDQAGLAQVYLEGYQITRDPLFAKTAREIFTYVLRDLTADKGGFYSAQDADSEGEEGKFYLWNVASINAVLGDEDAAFFCGLFNLTEEGNYLDESQREKTGQNILYLSERPELIAKSNNSAPAEIERRIESCREKLSAARKLRTPPLTDDKILTAWNGMMISALAAGGRILNDQSYTVAAQKAAEFILTAVCSPDKKLLRRYREGEAAIDAFAEDYAFLAKGLLDLYRATFNPNHLKQGIDLAEQLAVRFMDQKSGLIFETPKENSELFVRPKNLFDAAHPSTNAITLQLFARLHLLTGAAVWKERSEAVLTAITPSLQSYPAGFTAALQGVALLLEPTREVVLVGDKKSDRLTALIETTNQVFAPETSTVLQNEAIAQLAPFTQQMAKQRTAAAYICQNNSCRPAISDPNELAALLTTTP